MILVLFAILSFSLNATMESARTPVMQSRELSQYHQKAKSAVQSVLNRDEFAQKDVERTSFRKWLAEKIRNLLEGIDRFFKGLPKWLMKLIVVWMVLTLLAILGHFCFVLTQMVRRGRRFGTSGSELETVGEIYGIRDLDFDSVNKRARELLIARDWDGALRYLYVAAILWLDRKGLIAFRRHKTNRDFLREMPAQENQSILFLQMTDQFEQTIYASQPVQEADCARMNDWLSEMTRNG